MARRVIGWNTWEHLVIGLVNAMKCDSCQALLNYNGLPPVICPKCGQPTKKVDKT